MSTSRIESFPATPATPVEPQESKHLLSLSDGLRIALVAGAAVAVVLLRANVMSAAIVTSVALSVGGFPIWEEAWENIVQRRMTMELSMALAIVAAAVIREFFTALVITGFVLVAEILEELTVERGRRAVADLLGFLPQEIEIKIGDLTEKHPVEKLMPNDIVLIRPGARIPVDGLVVSGNSSVDESAITGEPMPADKQEGSTVLAGTVNHTGALEVQVVAVGRDTTFAKIVEAVERAEEKRAPIQKTADRLAGYLVYFALGGATLTFLFTHDIRSTISVVIVAGACGVAAGTPLAILGAIGRCAREGVILKGGIYLEALWKADTVILDKTGTVTFGRAGVTEIVPATGVSHEEVLSAAALAERNSEHPLAQAVIARAAASKVSVANPEVFRYTPGLGVLATRGDRTVVAGNWNWLSAQGVEAPVPVGTGTHILVAENGRYLGQVIISDQVRRDAQDAISELHRLRLQTVLLSGDTEAVANSVGSSLAIEKSVGGLLPHEKSEYVRRMAGEGRSVVMVGDGINDAPALAEASVGIAMGSGTDVARETAHGLLIGNDLLKLVSAIRTSRWCRRIVMQNFYGTVLVDLGGIGLASVGLISPLLAALIHVTSELAFILNSTRLLSRRV